MDRKVLIVFLIIDGLAGALGVAAAFLTNNVLIGTFVWFVICSLFGFSWLEYNAFLKDKEKDNNEN